MLAVAFDWVWYALWLFAGPCNAVPSMSFTFHYCNPCQCHSEKIVAPIALTFLLRSLYFSFRQRDHGLVLEHSGESLFESRFSWEGPFQRVYRSLYIVAFAFRHGFSIVWPAYYPIRVSLSTYGLRCRRQDLLSLKDCLFAFVFVASHWFYYSSG